MKYLLARPRPRLFILLELEFGRIHGRIYLYGLEICLVDLRTGTDQRFGVVMKEEIDINHMATILFFVRPSLHLYYYICVFGVSQNVRTSFLPTVLSPYGSMLELIRWLSPNPTGQRLRTSRFSTRRCRVPDESRPGKARTGRAHRRC